MYCKLLFPTPIGLLSDDLNLNLFKQSHNYMIALYKECQFTTEEGDRRNLWGSIQIEPSCLVFFKFSCVGGGILSLYPGIFTPTWDLYHSS